MNPIEKLKHQAEGGAKEGGSWYFVKFFVSTDENGVRLKFPNHGCELVKAVSVSEAAEKCRKLHEGKNISGIIVGEIFDEYNNITEETKARDLNSDYLRHCTDVFDFVLSGYKSGLDKKQEDMYVDMYKMFVQLTGRLDATEFERLFGHKYDVSDFIRDKVYNTKMHHIKSDM